MENINIEPTISERLKNYLEKFHCGEENAVSAADIRKSFGLNPRQIRFIVSNLRIAGEPICSGKTGYYFASCKSEVVKTQNLMFAQAASLMDAATGMGKYLS